MPVDAHIHFASLSERDPGFPERFALADIEACAACHSAEEFDWTEKLRESGLRFRISLGIHPQSPAMDHAGFLAAMVEAGRVDVIGEAGFDFFGDRPEYSRTPENLVIQRRAFEFQLGLALDARKPLLVHVRKAMDLVFEYTRDLARLPAVVFHSWPGTPGEAKALLHRRIPAYFSFGAIVLNGHKRAIESLAGLPDDRILSETDAPWQAPRGGAYCRFEDIHRVVDGMARIRNTDIATINSTIAGNWSRIFGGPG